MNILVSNDDGYKAPGITALAERLQQLGRTVVVAPDRNRSGVSSGLTLTQGMYAVKHAEDLYSVEGTPADCVNIALAGLLSFEPDIVVSGINDGPNMADDTLYSGTVGAAAEGRFLGTPSIAVSMASFHPDHFDTAAEVTARIIESINLSSLPRDTILNVNVPDTPLAEIKGIVSTRLGTRHAPERAGEHSDPRGQKMFWHGAAGTPDDTSEGTDFHAVSQGKVSVTPLKVDMTRHDSIGQVQQWLDAVAWNHKT